MNEHLWWYVARASGLTGWVLCTLSVLWGLFLSTRLLGRKPAPGWLLDLHRFLGGLATVFIAVHMVGLVADSYAHFGPAELFLPLASAWRPGPVAWGVVAFYLLVAVELTSLLRRRLPARMWRVAHMASLPLWVAGTVHTLAAGTDASHPALQWTALLSSVLVLFAVLVRVLSPRARGARRMPTAPSPAPAAPSPPARAGTRAGGDARERAAAARAAVAARRAAEAEATAAPAAAEV